MLSKPLRKRKRRQLIRLRTVMTPMRRMKTAQRAHLTKVRWPETRRTSCKISKVLPKSVKSKKRRTMKLPMPRQKRPLTKSLWIQLRILPRTSSRQLPRKDPLISIRSRNSVP